MKRIQYLEAISPTRTPLSALAVVLATVVVLGTHVATSLVPAVVVVARVPIIESQGTVRLRTDEDAQTVVESFTGPTPPTLVFQWGIADEITTGDETVRYRLSSLFGLRSVEVAVEAQTGHTPAGDPD